MKMFKVTRRTLYNWIDNGTLKPIRIGKLYRFDPEEIDSLINQGRLEAAIKPKSLKAKKKIFSILAIDDDFLIRKSLKALLERAGFEVTVAASGDEALKLLKTENYSLVLTDVRMPGMNGIEALKAMRGLRAELGKPNVPEVVMSAYDDLSTRKQAEEMGVRDFVMKPFDWDYFVETLKKNLN